MLLIILLCLYVIGNVFSFWFRSLKEKISYFAPISAAGFLLLAFWDLITAKLNLLHFLYFPNPDTVFNVFVTSWQRLAYNVFFSLRLWFVGVIIGLIIGFAAGVAMGWNRRWSFWLTPLQRIIGSIPPTAWIPIALLVSPTTFWASVILVALAVIFPVSVMTGSGVANVNNRYFEVARTLGAGKKYLIFRVAIPAALPSIVLGLFWAFCSSFLILVVAETIGVKAGIGFYIVLQERFGVYQQMWASLMVVSLMFWGLITLLMVVKNRLLVWQKGLIKW
jgi:NitT/TauT family transport system permease protein